MKPVPTKDATHKFVKPTTWDDAKDGICGDLSVRVQRFNGTERLEYLSTWAPSEEEIAMLVSGGVVVLSVVGAGQPPVGIWVEECPHKVADDSTAPLDGRQRAEDDLGTRDLDDGC